MVKTVTVDGVTFKVRSMPSWLPMAAITLLGAVWIKEQYWATSHGHDILRHEAVHVRDQRKYHVLFWLTYILLPLPGPLTLRGFWEWRAYRVTLRALMERYGTLTSTDEATVTRHLSGPLYWWAVPRSLAARLVAREAQRLRQAPPGPPKGG